MKREYLSFAAILMVIGFLLVLGGCGSSGNKEDDTSAVSKVSEIACTTCHSTTVENLTGAPIVANYVSSKHNLSSVGCQDCHGAGGQHNGVGPIPYPDPTSPKDPTKAQCYTCHSDKTSYASSKHAAGEDEFEQKCNRCHTHQGAVLADSSGFTGDKAVMDALVGAPAALAEDVGEHIKCTTCHETHKTDQLRTVVGWDPNGSGGATDQFDLCTSCHVYTNAAGTLVTSGTGVYSTSAFYHSTAWYRIIPSTHYDNPLTGVGLASTTIEGYNIRKNSANPCFDCHGHEFKTNTGNLTRNSAGQYTLDTTVEATNYTDWAKSGHAGGLLTAKYAAQDAYPKKSDGTYDRSTGMTDAVFAAGVTGETGPAWEHYNWDNSTGTSDDRKTCQRCHTSTGVSNFLTAKGSIYDATYNPTGGYNPANNDFSHLSGWTSTNMTSPQNEMLYCWGCHSNAAKGTLRDPGALKILLRTPSSSVSANVEVSFPDAKGSNVCLACHSGRETGETIKKATDDFSNKSFVNSHYLPAGGTVFALTGYHYDGRDYTIPASDLHDNIGFGTTGNTDVDATAKNGPCAGCHFGSLNGSHTLSPVTKYTSTDTSINPLCVNCHTTRGEGTNSAITWLGDDATAATLQGSTHKARYQAGLEALKVQLELKGYAFSSGYPYFTAKNWLSAGDTDTTGAVTGKNNLGAAFNYNMLIHEPGGVAHNRRYTRRLIYDAIDWIDNGVLDYSVSATLNALSETTDVYKASAISYLLNAQTGTSADRH